MSAKKVAVKSRLDEETVKRGLVPTLEKARALIMAGEVLVEGQVVYKADTQVTEEGAISLKEKFPYASRGALKIEKALTDFCIDVDGLQVLDIGISTGGFSDYMLQNGAVRAAGVDVNTRQVDDRLRQDTRLKLIETNARSLMPEQVGFQPDLITVDVSFISITRILPALSVQGFRQARIVSLVKPQFEAKPGDVSKGGVVRDAAKRIDVLVELKQRVRELGFAVTGFTNSGIKGRKGNREYFFLLEYGKKPSINDTIIADAIKSEL
jgi:23S rRNA (cytidine1920-2'-O)/16S rRNA (cytidine1409-2'-O)-methyltransferase